VLQQVQLIFVVAVAALTPTFTFSFGIKSRKLSSNRESSFARSTSPFTGRLASRMTASSNGEQLTTSLTSFSSGNSRYLYLFQSHRSQLIHRILHTKGNSRLRPWDSLRQYTPRTVDELRRNDKRGFLAFSEHAQIDLLELSRAICLDLDVHRSLKELLPARDFESFDHEFPLFRSEKWVADPDIDETGLDDFDRRVRVGIVSLSVSLRAKRDRRESSFDRKILLAEARISRRKVRRLENYVQQV